MSALSIYTVLMRTNSPKQSGCLQFSFFSGTYKGGISSWSVVYLTLRSKVAFLAVREAWIIITIKLSEGSHVLPVNHPAQERPFSTTVDLQALDAKSATFSNVECTVFLLLCLTKALRYHLTVYRPIYSVEKCRVSAERKYVVLHVFKYVVSAKG